MPSLRELQLQFAAALVDRTSPSRDISLADGGLATYRRNGRANYRKALAATYPVVKRLTGVPFFNAAVDEFVVVHSPVFGDLNVYGGCLADFLDRYAPAATLPYLADVARLEWAIDEANRAADTARVPDAVLAALTMVDPQRMPSVRLLLDASCRIVESPYPVLRIWRANQPDRSGTEPIALDEGGVRLLVRRDADGVALESLSDGEHAWLNALAGAATLGAAIEAALAAEPAFDLGVALRRHITAGSISAIVDR